MKKIISKSNTLCWIAVILIVSAAISCRKYNYLGYTPGSGAPKITSVHTLTKADSVLKYDTVVTYNSSGDTTLKIDVTETFSSPFDSATSAGSLGNTYVIEGANLGSAVSITFNGQAAYFNRALTTDNALIVAIPGNTPYAGTQATDSLVVVTTHGTAYYKFSIIPPPPTASTYSDYNFWNGSQISLTGVGFTRSRRSYGRPNGNNRQHPQPDRHDHGAPVPLDDYQQGQPGLFLYLGWEYPHRNRKPGTGRPG